MRVNDFIVVSNFGEVLAICDDRVAADAACLKLNIEDQANTHKYYVIKVTPYRLVCDVEDALELQSFVFVTDGDNAYWFMSGDEYRRQLWLADEVWKIAWPGGSMVAEFDDIWYEQLLNNN